MTPSSEGDDVLEVRITDLELPFRIGVLESEKNRRQPVRINIQAYVPFEGRHTSDQIDDYVSYADIVERVRALSASEEHVNLVETLAERICDAALRDTRIDRVTVRVEKPTIIPEAASVGVVVRRRRSRST